MAGGAELVNKISSLELENKSLKKVTEDLRNLVLTLEKRVASLEGKSGGAAPAPAKAEPAKPAADDDDDVDLFGSDDEEEDAEAARVFIWIFPSMIKHRRQLLFLYIEQSCDFCSFPFL